MRRRITHRRKVLLLFALGLCFPFSGMAQAPERYQQVIVYDLPTAALSRLPSFDEHTLTPVEKEGGMGIATLLSESDVRTLQEEGIDVEIVIPDLQRFYAERAKKGMEKKRENDQSPSLLSADDPPEHFILGSVAGNYSPLELEIQLQRMHELYPDLVSAPISIGKSTQGRDILAVRISARPESEKLPEALYTGMHHAREPISMMSLVYAMWFMLEQYSRDPETTRLLESRSLWFVPLVNPDGYAYNIQYFPNGGGLWRKNRGGNQNEGIDLNRNYGSTETWQIPPDLGADDPVSGNYRGPAPFSEPETRAVRDFVRAHDFRVALNFHSYSNVLVYRHGGAIFPLADTGWHIRSARELTLENGLGHGHGTEAIGYDAAGTADEWLLGSANPNYPIFSWTPEIGSPEDGFWPAPERIFSLCRRMVPMTIRAAWMAGPLPRVVSWQSADPETGKELILTVSNIGTQLMKEEGEITLKKFPGASIPFPPLAPGESRTLRLLLPKEITDSISSRTELDLRISSAGDEWSRTIDPMVHPEIVLFNDDFEGSLSRWHMGLWDIETKEGRGRVLSDSPYENYFQSDIPNVIELAQPISLAGYDAAELQFDATVTTQGTSHNLAVEVRRGGTGEWNRIDGDYLQSPAGENSDVRGELRGGNRSWEHYAIPLDRYAGDEIAIRFVMNTPRLGNSDIVFDGALIDNLKVMAARPISTSVRPQPGTESDPDISLWPNPCGDIVYVRQPENRPILSLQLIDMLGRKTEGRTVLPVGSSSGFVDMQGLAKGAYILSVTCENRTIRKKILKGDME